MRLASSGVLGIGKTVYKYRSVSEKADTTFFAGNGSISQQVPLLAHFDTVNVVVANPFGSAWQSRRVVVTKEFVAFAFVNQDDEIDRVPLAGVDFVKAHDETGVEIEGLESAQSTQFYTLQIATNPSGYNSGKVSNRPTKCFSVI